MSQNRKYNIEHRKVRKTTMIYEDQLSWIARNQPDEIKSEAEFICLLLSLGIQAFVAEKLEAGEKDGGYFSHKDVKPGDVVTDSQGRSWKVVKDAGDE